MGESVSGEFDQRLIGGGRPTDPAVTVAEAFAEALAALDEDRRLIAFARSTVRDLYLALEERDRRIVNARLEIQRGYIAAEAIVSARGAGRTGRNRRAKNVVAAA